MTLEARLIDDLLDMTRMGRGAVQLYRGPVDLRAIAERAVEVCRAELDAAGLILEVDAGTAPRMVDADADRIQQVFSNLLRNAIKFTPSQGRVRIRVGGDDEWCEAEISDTGAGIDPEFLPRAFNAFEQGDRSRTRKPGLGLGLSISKMIVELHGGIITARSEGRDRGASFLVQLPALAGARPKSDPVVLEEPRRVQPRRILFVEDDPDTARVMRWLLKADGHTVQWAGDVATALRLATSHQFDLLLSDLGLPDGSGVDLIRALRHAGITLPGIALSGYGQDEDLARSRDAGFAAHLVKPVSPSIIREAIDAVVGEEPR